MLARINRLVDDEYPHLDRLYKHLHANPELSLQEQETARIVAKELRTAGCKVTENIGGYGVVGVMANGRGPTVLIRADMDALPITEDTGLPYASTVKAIDASGNEVGVMHACGHDIHTTVLIGAARTLGQLSACWNGTIIFVAQAAEEQGSGAKSMLGDGLYTRFPRPDFGLGLHVFPNLPAGMIGYRAGPAMAGNVSLRIMIKGTGCHAAFPHHGHDPVVLSARIILALQTIVSRELDPLEPAVVTVGQIRGGTAVNIIPESVVCTASVRYASDAVRERILEAIQRTCAGEALAAGLPENLAPVVTRAQTGLPPVYNDPGLTRRVVRVFEDTLGKGCVLEVPFVMGSEDFAWYGQVTPPIPTFFFTIGSSDPAGVPEVKARQDEVLRNDISARLSHHTPYFAPVPEPTIKTGVTAMAAAAMDLLPAVAVERCGADRE